MNPSTRAVRVVLLWHMHQPCYRDPTDGTFVLPWVRLHALKDYLGMVEVLEATPEVRVTFNLVPALLDQLEAYARGEAREALLALSLKPAAELGEAERVLALKGFFLAHSKNLIGRFPRFAELAERRGPGADEASLREAAARFSTQDLLDLQVVSKLAWFDLGWQERDPLLRDLTARGGGFDEGDKARLAERESALLRGVIPAYRRAASRGQVELSTSPYYHPILPLLCDTEAHREVHPAALLPRRFRHPEDAADQIRRATARHAELFGAPPAGMWPPEGSVSEEAVLEIARAGLRWTASDEAVLERSVNQPLHRDSRGTAYPLEVLYRPWVFRTAAGPIAMLFRDRALSDLIGFSYSGMEPTRAAQDLLGRLRRVGERWQGQQLPGHPVVSMILDGENAWEHFADGGRVFLKTLYEGLAAGEGIETLTASEAVGADEPGHLPRVSAGSWIHGDFSVWIGHADDRRAWELLGDARDALGASALAASEGRVPVPALERAREAFRAASGSDWCWWYGEEHHSENDIEFDRLFRRQLRTVYESLGDPVPDVLGETLITTRKVEVRQSRPTGAVVPVLDGEITTPEEWVAAGVHRVPLSAMRPGSPGVGAIRFGVGTERLHVLVEGPAPLRERLASAEFVLSFPGPTALRYRVHTAAERTTIRREERTTMGWVGLPTRAQAAAGSVLEVGVPLAELRPGPDRSLEFRVLVLEGDAEVERHPEAGPIEISLEDVSRE